MFVRCLLVVFLKKSVVLLAGFTYWLVHSVWVVCFLLFSLVLAPGLIPTVLQDADLKMTGFPIDFFFFGKVRITTRIFES